MTLIDAGSCGKAADEYDVRIVDEYDIPVLRVAVGEFVCEDKRALDLHVRILKMPDKTAEIFS